MKQNRRGKRKWKRGGAQGSHFANNAANKHVAIFRQMTSRNIAQASFPMPHFKPCLETFASSPNPRLKLSAWLETVKTNYGGHFGLASPSVPELGEVFRFAALDLCSTYPTWSSGDQLERVSRDAVNSHPAEPKETRRRQTSLESSA